MGVDGGEADDGRHQFPGTSSAGGRSRAVRAAGHDARTNGESRAQVAPEQSKCVAVGVNEADATCLSCSRWTAVREKETRTCGSGLVLLLIFSGFCSRI